MEKMKDKVVLAFSGGLDSSFCVKCLNDDKGLEVHSVIVNTGGFNASELKVIEERALSLGVCIHTVSDVEDEYYRNYIRCMVYGNVLKNSTYPL